MAHNRPALNIGNTVKTSSVKSISCKTDIDVIVDGAGNVNIGDRVEHNHDVENVEFGGNITYSDSKKDRSMTNVVTAMPSQHSTPSTSNAEGTVFAGNTNIGGKIENVKANNIYANMTYNINPKAHLTPDTILFQVNEPEDNFTGRSAELCRLGEFFNGCAKTGVLYGMGGVGKTQLMRKFIQLNISKYKKIVWINSDEIEIIEESFRKLSKDELRLPTRDANMEQMDPKSVITRALKLLCGEQTLIIYDNVDSVESTEYVKSILAIASAPDAKKPQVLIASRHQEWPSQMELFPLKVWDESESIEYISKIMNDSGGDSESDKKSLAETMQYFPLALRQATAYIRVQRRRMTAFKISHFIETFSCKTREILNDKSFKNEMISIYEKTTYTTWLITMDEIEKDESNGALAMRIFKIIAYCDADQIATKLLYYVEVDEECDEWKIRIDSAVDLLVMYCMVDLAFARSYEDGKLSIHRLVQKVTKILLQESNEEEATLRDAMQLLTNVVPKQREPWLHDIDYESLLLGSHTRSIFESVLASSNKMNLIKDFSSLAFLVLRDMGVAVLGIGDYLDRDFGNKILNEMTNVLGPTNRSVLKSRYHIALSVIYEDEDSDDDDDDNNDGSDNDNYLSPLPTNSDDFKTTKKLCKDDFKNAKILSELLNIYEIQRAHLSDVDSDTVETQCRIAFVYLMSQKLDEAANLFKNHPPFACKFDDLIKMAGKSKGSKENKYLAVRSYQAFFEIQKNLLGDGHFETILNMMMAADLHYEEGNHELSFKWYQKMFRIISNRNSRFFLEKIYADIVRDSPLRFRQFILKKQKDSLGSDHLETLRTLFHLANGHNMFGNYNAAIQLYEIVYQKQAKEFGKIECDNPEVNRLIAEAYIQLSKIDSLLEWYKRALDMEVNFTGRRTILEEMLNAVYILRQNKDHKLALRWYEFILEKQKSVLREKTVDTAPTMCKIASTLVDLKDFNQAIHWYLNVLDVRTKCLGEYHYETLETMCHIADAMSKLKDYQGSLSVYGSVLEKQNSMFGEIHNDTLETHCHIARTYSNLISNDVALDLYKNVLDKLCENTNDDVHWSTIEEAVDYLLTDENYDLAFKLNTILLDKQQLFLVAADERIVSTLNRMAKIELLLIKQNPSNALQLIEAKLEKQKKCLGDYHDDTLKTLCLIARAQSKVASNDAALALYRNVLVKLIERAPSMNEVNWTMICREADCHYEDDNYDLAFELYDVIFRKQKNLLGADDYRTRYTSSRMTDTQIGGSEKSLAALQFLDTLKNNEEGHSGAFNTMHAIADAYSDLKIYNLALQYYQDLFDTQQGLYGEQEEHFDEILETMFKLTRTHSGLGNYNDACNIYGSGLEIATTNFNDFTWKKFHIEASFQFDEENYDLTLRMYQLILEKQMFWLEVDHSETLKTMHGIACTLKKLQRYDDALSTFVDVLKRRENVIGEFHSDTLETMSQLAHLHKELGNCAAAKQLYRQLYATMKYLKGDQHRDTLDAFRFGGLDEEDVFENYLPEGLREEWEFVLQYKNRRSSK